MTPENEPTSQPQKRPASKADDRAKAAEDDAPQAAVNPVELDPDKLPPVPGPGQFMSPDDATEEVAPAPTAEK